MKANVSENAENGLEKYEGGSERAGCGEADEGHDCNCRSETFKLSLAIAMFVDRCVREWERFNAVFVGG